MSKNFDNTPLTPPVVTDHMNDREFIASCFVHCEAGRPGWTPAQVQRLMRLAGMNEAADHHNRLTKDPRAILECSTKTMLELVEDAQRHLPDPCSGMGSAH